MSFGEVLEDDYARDEYYRAGDADTVIADLKREIRRLKRGEFICKKCGLRKNGRKPNVDF